MDATRLGFWCSLDLNYGLFFLLHGLFVEICKWDKSSLMVVRRSIYPECHLESGVFSFSTGLARADRNQLIEFIDNILWILINLTAVLNIGETNQTQRYSYEFIKGNLSQNIVKIVI